MIYSPMHPKANKKGYVYEHRLIMENHIGRFLTDSEVVHHKDSNRSNNTIDNLELLTISEHHRLHGVKMAIEKGYKTYTHSQCPICGGPKFFTSKVCTKCYHERIPSKRICPSKDVLASMLSTTTLDKVALKLGVTRTTIRRWIESLGISYSSKRHLNKGRAKKPLELGNSTMVSASGSDPEYVCSIHASPTILH